MLTSGQKPAPASGSTCASRPPSAPPIISSGASTPPEVPEPSDTDQMVDFTTSTPTIARQRRVALQEARDHVVADAERLREDEAAEADDEAADRRPPHPVDRQLREGVLGGVDGRVRAGPRARRRAGPTTHAARAGPRGPMNERMGRHREERARGPAGSGAPRAAVALASATGMKLRGFHSKSSSSTASSTAATGAAKVADMPAAAPATSSVLRSALVRWKSCATIEPNAPPVMMIGPSAPNGPPEPMEIADESGLSSATLRLDAAALEQDRLDGLGDAVAADPLRAVARHEPDDQRADDRARARPAARGGGRRARPARCSSRWKKKRLVKSPISRSSARATNALRTPMPTAIAEMGRTRQVVVKSPSSAGVGGGPRCSRNIS